MTIQGSKIGDEYQDALFSRSDDTDSTVCKECMSVVSGASLGVVLSGPVGVGKTHWLVCLAREFEAARWGGVPLAEDGGEAIQLGRPWRELASEFDGVDLSDAPAPTLTKAEIENSVDVRFWYVPELLSSLQTEVAEGILWTENKCKECDLLVLDDLGVERETAYRLERLEGVIDYRYRNKLPMAVTTNCSMKELEERYGERLTSRLLKQCVIVEMSGKDRRWGE